MQIDYATYLRRVRCRSQTATLRPFLHSSSRMAGKQCVEVSLCGCILSEPVPRRLLAERNLDVSQCFSRVDVPAELLILILDLFFEVIQRVQRTMKKWSFISFVNSFYSSTDVKVPFSCACIAVPFGFKNIARPKACMTNEQWEDFTHSERTVSVSSVFSVLDGLKYCSQRYRSTIYPTKTEFLTLLRMLLLVTV